MTALSCNPRFSKFYSGILHTFVNLISPLKALSEQVLEILSDIYLDFHSPVPISNKKSANGK